MAWFYDFSAWLLGLEATNRIAAGALLVALLAFFVAVAAARFAQIQASVTRKQHLRTVVKDMESDLIILRQVAGDIRTECAVAFSTIEKYVAEIGRPIHQRLGPPGKEILRTAITIARKDDIAGVKLQSVDKKLFANVAATAREVTTALTSLREGCDQFSQQSMELSALRRVAQEKIRSLEAYKGAMDEACRRLEPLAAAQISKVERKTR